MKAEKKQIGLPSRILATVTRNWGLKLLSLILAIIVYHSLKPGHAAPSDSHDRSIFQSK